MLGRYMCALLHPTQKTIRPFSKQAKVLSMTQLWAAEAF